MLADLVILSRNLFECSAGRMTQAQCDVTVVDGKIVYQR